MAKTVRAEQFNTQGRKVRDVDVTVQRSYNPTSDAYTGDFILHITIGSRVTSVKISAENWESLIQVGQGRPSQANRSVEARHRKTDTPGVTTPPIHMWQQTP